MRDRDGQASSICECEIETLDTWDEPGEGQDCCRPWAAHRERQRVRHDSSLREAPERDSLPADPVLLEGCGEVFRELFEGGQERLAIGKADLPNDVPVPASRRERQRPAGKDSEKCSGGIE